MNSYKEERNLLKAYNMMLYFAGTMLMYEPNHECIRDFWNEGILKTLPVSSSNPRFMKAASQLRYSISNEDSAFLMMKEDYIALFDGRSGSHAPPYESVYRSKDHLMFDLQTYEVRDFYRSYGWESKFKNKIPDDHLSIELLFLTILIEKYLELDDHVCHIEMKNEIIRYINQHLLSWIPKWNEHIQQHASTLGYKGVGTLIHACVEDMSDLLEKENLSFKNSD
jgi:TorA maturation chaperone TorD